MKVRDQWSIYRPRGWDEAEWWLVNQSKTQKPPAPLIPDNSHAPETVLYGPQGQPIVQRVSRPLGFRPPK